MRLSTGRAGARVLAAAGIACAVLAGCAWIQAEKQLKGMMDLRILSRVVEEYRAERGRLPSLEELDGLLGESALEDRWGNPIVYRTFPDEEGERYLLASWGSDGEADVADVESYLTADREDVTDEYTRDLVIVDGSAVRVAGK
jgi:hypothetical protein